MPFEIAKPISKKQFLEVYKESVFITQLIFAPFGLSPSIANILGESNAIDTYTLMFQQWEDVVSKRIFSARGFDDDRIIASMHKFVGGSDSQDSEVVSEVREACEALKKMIRIPSVVEFDFRQMVSPTTTEPMFDLCTAPITAKLLSKVITILQSLFLEDESEKLENEIHSETTSTDLKNEVDSEVFESFKLSIPCNVFSPSRFYASKSSAVYRRLCSGLMVATLRNALVLSATELVDNANVGVSAFTVTFSLQQFHAMLDIHRASAEVQQVLSQYCGTSTTTSGNLLNEIRIGAQLVSINHANQLPTVSYIEQLTALLPHSVIPPLSEAEKEAQRQKQEKEEGSGEESAEGSDSENKSDEPKKDSVSSAADETTATTESAESADNNPTKSEPEDQTAPAPACPYSEAEIAQMSASLELALAAVRLLQEGKEAAVVGDLDTAIDCISQVINKYTNSLVDEEDEEEDLAEKLREKLNVGDSNESKDAVKPAEDKKFSRLVLPVFLRVQLYTERATYYAEQGELVDALEDISIAIELDRFNVSAYSLRSQIATAQFAQEQEAAAAALEEEDDDPYAGLRYGKPKKGAKAKKAKKAQGEEDNEEGAVVSPVVLEKVSMDTAAEDALAAFLLGGCTDLELAAAAEETAREQCRLNAKDIFRDRVLRDKDVSPTGDIGGETTTVSLADEATVGVSTAAESSLLQDNLPRSWLVGSYFSGYTQLSSALDVHYTKEEEESVRNILNVSAQHHSTGSLNDICDDDNNCGIDATVVAGDLARPPAHLLDPVSASTTETITETTDPDAESHDIDESSPEDVTGGDGLQALDKEGYSLLVQLVREMEIATYSSNNNSNSAAKDMVIGGQLLESADDENENDGDTDCKKAANVVYDVTSTSAEDSSEWDHLESLFAAGQLRLRDQGLLEPMEEEEQRSYHGWKHVSVGAGAVINSKDVETEPVPSTPPAEATDATEVSSASDSIGQPCPHFKAAIALLCSDLAYQLTGVRLNRNGTIAHLDYDTYKSSFVAPQDTPVGEERDSDGEEQEESPRKAKKSDKSKTGKKDKKHSDKKKSAKKTKKAAHHFSQHSLHESDSEGDDDDDEYFQGGESGEDMDEDELYAFMAAAASGIAGAEWNMNNASFGEDDSDSDEDYVPGQSDSGDSNKSLSGDDDEEEDDEGAWESCSGDSQEDQGEERNEPVVDSHHEEEDEGEWEDCESSESEAEEQKPEWKKTTPPPTNKSVSDSIRASLAKAQPPVAAVVDQISEPLQTSADHTEKAGAEDNSDNVASNPAVDSSFFAEVSIISCEDLPAFDNTFLEEGEEEDEEEEEEQGEKSLDVLPIAGDNVDVAIGGQASAVLAAQETNPAVGGAESTVVLPEISLSHKLRARLLNICGSVAYLSGDATGAVACLRASLLEDATLLDSKVKLGSLLIDMDEQAEAAKLLKEAKKSEPNNAVVLLHMAELFINQNDFEAAVKYLRKAQRAVPFYHSNRSAGSSEALKERERMERVNLEDIQANAAALLGISLFRINPTRPDIAISVLEEGLSEHPNSVILLICSGEVQSQAGDMVRALQSFRKANALDGRNPLPFINAARTYQQLGQFETASAHIRTAIAMDPALAMTRVDLAQNLMQSGRTEEALDMLNIALSLARQVSEIRDVLTARNVANMQLKLERAGLYIPVR